MKQRVSGLTALFLTAALCCAMLLCACNSPAENGMPRGYIFSSEGEFLGQTGIFVESSDSGGVGKVSVLSNKIKDESTEYRNFEKTDFGYINEDGACAVYEVQGEKVVGIGDWSEPFCLMVGVNPELYDAEARSVGVKLNTVENVREVYYLGGDAQTRGFQVLMSDNSKAADTAAALESMEGVSHVRCGYDVWHWVVVAWSHEEASATFETFHSTVFDSAEG